MTDAADALVDQILGSLPNGARTLLAVDGVGASGKTTFASRVARRSIRPTLILHADDFFNPPAIRHARGRTSAEGFWLDTYDQAAFTQLALDPLLAGEPTIRTSSWDRSTNEAASDTPVHVGPDALVVVEGTFLHRPHLRDYWYHSVFLDIGFDVAVRRMQQREHDQVDEGLIGRYYGAQRLYFDHSQPWSRATWVVDNANPNNPVIIQGQQSAAARLEDWPAGP